MGVGDGRVNNDMFVFVFYNVYVGVEVLFSK